MPTKEEERFGVELALICRPRCDQPFLMFRAEAGVAPPALALVGQ